MIILMTGCDLNPPKTDFPDKAPITTKIPNIDEGYQMPDDPDLPEDIDHDGCGATESGPEPDDYEEFCDLDE